LIGISNLLQIDELKEKISTDFEKEGWKKRKESRAESEWFAFVNRRD
jgi:hypothetical protein